LSVGVPRPAATTTTPTLPTQPGAR
jgi:hypothetical protein